MYTREQVAEKLKGFTNADEFFEHNGILLYIPIMDHFCLIAFGDGTNSDSLEEGCDDYIYIALYRFDESFGFSEEIDGGQLDYNTKTAGYGNDITNAVYDALEFTYEHVPNFIPLKHVVH